MHVQEFCVRMSQLTFFSFLSILSTFVAIEFSEMYRYDFHITEILHLCLFVSLVLFHFCLLVLGAWFFASWFCFDLSKTLSISFYIKATQNTYELSFESL